MEATPRVETSPIARKQYARPVGEHISLGSNVRLFLFAVSVAVLAALIYAAVGTFAGAAKFVLAFMAGMAWVAISGVRVAAQWERAVVLRWGKFQGLAGPGLMYIVPLANYIRFIDTRTLVLNIPKQKVITKDNVPAQIDGALFFNVVDPVKALVEIQDFKFAATQYAQATLRDVVGGLTLDELLSEREQIQDRIGKSVEERIRAWGLRVDSIRLLDIELPEDLKRVMSRQASAEREKRATITKAEGDKLAAVNLAEAARIMGASPGAMQLRSLQTIDGLGPTPSNTIVLFPANFAEAASALAAAKPKQPEPAAQPKPAAPKAGRKG